jgi:hypothetical protein
MLLLPQALPHCPQLLGSVWRFTQAWPHCTVGGWQLITVWHIAATQS